MADKNSNISLRDHFAGIALQSIMQSEDQMYAASDFADLKEIEIQQAVAVMAYTQADLMMKERNKSQQQKPKKTA